MGSEKFSLRWNDFETNINEAFRELRDGKDFFDVTLVCDDEHIQAHKVVLGACSPFFRTMLRRNTHQHPMIYLRGVQFSDLQSVLNFMYQGEVNIAQEELNSFLAVAEDLRVKGLTQKDTENDKFQSRKQRTETSTKLPAVASRLQQQPTKQQKVQGGSALAENRFSSHNKPSTDDDEIQEEVHPVKSEPADSAYVSSSAVQAPTQQQQDQYLPGQASYPITTQEDTLDYQEEDYGDYEQYEEGTQYQQPHGLGTQVQAKGCQFEDPSDLLQFVRKDPGDQRFYCILCDKFSHTVITCARNHVESQHYPDTFSYPCDLCDQILTSRNKFNNHKRLKHKKQKVMY